jgi:cell pole-organizing protein PopZ
MASNPQHEPTMEEILASIRKIISEDSTEQPAAPSAAAAVPPEADVLELTQELPADPPPAAKPAPVAAAPAPTPAPKPVEDIVFQTVEEPAPKPAAPAPTPAPVAGDDIFSDKTRKALDDTFAKIPAAVEPAAPTPAPAPARALNIPEGASVEAVFERAVASAFDPLLNQWMDHNKTDLLNAVKPLIREWMDEHFPALLEGAVRNEVERVVRSRGGK